MAEFLGDIVAWMEGLSPAWIYATVFAVAYIENVVPPIPGDMIVVFGGYLAGRGQVDLVTIILLATVSGSLGFMSMYAIGRIFGEAVLDPNRMRWIPKTAAWKVRTWLQRYGYGVIAANRFLSGARAVISLMVGVARMPAGPVALWATLSAGLWIATIAYLGAVVGDNWAIVGEWLKRYGQGVTALLIVVVLVYVGVQVWRRRVNIERKQAGSQRNGEDPETGISGARES